MRIEDVLARIEPKEVVDLALALGNIDSPTGSEGPAGEFVFQWLVSNGFAPKKYALIPERFNVAAWIDGSGGGHSLIFNAHLDTTLRPDAVWSALDPKDPLYHSAWVEGDSIYGDGVVNDKGPMAAYLLAAKEIKAAGYPLKGDLIVSAVCGEISREPIEECRGRCTSARISACASWSRTASSPITPWSRRVPASESSASSPARRISR